MIKEGDYIKSNYDGLIVKVTKMPDWGIAIEGGDDPEYVYGKNTNHWVEFTTNRWKLYKAYNSPLYKVLNGE